MKRRAVQLLIAIAIAAVCGAASSRAQEPTTKPAQASAVAWLSLIDNQNYAASWDAAASAFRSAITKEKWEAAVQAVRTPLGQMKSRELASAKSTTTLPGAPDGEYVVFQFTTSFEQKATAVETVTEVMENDGTWHVGGYFIR
ncbi:MAG: DUF4019 domain-containing protein [Acidobacteriota bacterium]